MPKIVQLLQGPAAQTAGVSILVSAIYFLVFGAQFAFNDLVPGGDTQTLWSFYYVALYSLRHFHEFIWWDPTALNGWPAYYLSYYGWSNMMSPFQLAQLIFGELISSVFGTGITRILVLQKTLFVVVINIVGVTLIARELVTTTAARILPPLIYAICHMQFMGYAAAGTVDALPAAIFFLYALIRNNNQRTPGSLGLLALFAGVYLGSMNYLLLQSHVYALGFFIALLLILFPDFLGSVWKNVTAIGKTAFGLASLLIGVLFLASGVAVFLVGVTRNLPNFARLNSGAVPYDINRSNQFEPPGYAITSTEAWTDLFYWIPYSDFHKFSMTFDPYSSGLDYRYIGLATLPLIVIAAIHAARNRYTLVFGGAFFICTAFIAYTHQNLPLSLLIEKSDIFKNIRTMAAVMPRDLVSLFPIFIAAIGLDFLLKGKDDSADKTGPIATTMKVDAVVAVVVVLVTVAIACLFALATAPSLAPIRKSLGHIGVYLLLFSGIVLVLHISPDGRSRMLLGWTLILITFVDLTTSVSDQWINNNIGGRYVHGKHTVTMRAEEVGIGPIHSEAESWPGANYKGMVHNMVHGGPYFGLKPWLVMATRPAWQPVLETWNAESRMVTRYPHFKFFTNGAFVPYESIRNVDSIQPPAVELPTELVIDGQGRTAIRFDGSTYVIRHGQAGAVERAEKSNVWQDRYVFAGWAVDRKVEKPARLVMIFLGNALWHIGSPSEARGDIAAVHPHLRPSGFAFYVPPLPAAASNGKTAVRVFAIMHDDTAIELQYGSGYRFSTVPAASTKTAATAKVSGPTFYLHDQGLVRENVSPRRLYDQKWEVLRFTLNRVKVRVNLPEPAYMVFLDNYDKSWRAYVDGKSVPVHRANFTFKTILLPAGESEVEWVFNPLAVKLSWCVYYLLFAVLILVLFLGRREQRYRMLGQLGAR